MGVMLFRSPFRSAPPISELSGRQSYVAIQLKVKQQQLSIPQLGDYWPAFISKSHLGTMPVRFDTPVLHIYMYIYRYIYLLQTHGIVCALPPCCFCRPAVARGRVGLASGASHLRLYKYMLYSQISVQH